MSIGRSLALMISGAAFLAFAGCGDTEGDYHAYTEPAVATTDPEPEPVTAVVSADPEPQTVETQTDEETVADDIEEAANRVSLDVVSVDPGLQAPGTIVEFAQAVAVDPEAALIAAAEVPDTLPSLTKEPREIELLVPDNTFREEGPEGAVRISYNDLDLLKVLNMEPVVPNAPDYFPDWLKNLEGRRIRLRGYMRPGPLSKDIPFFVLARDTQACCFGPNTKAYDIIPTLMRQGVTTEYIHLRPFDVVGVFHVNVEMDLDDETKVEFLYFIDDAVVIEK